jgi:ABC-type branched-subunit amino acid transport system ATPase component
MLKVDNLCKIFGGLKAVNQCSFEVQEGMIYGLIGPNGSGKTTTFNLITGFQEPSGGRVLFKGEEITGLAPYKIARLGIGRTFQLVRLFHNMTVMENVLLAFKDQSGERLFNAFFRPRQVIREQTGNEKKALELLEMLQIAPLRDEYVGNLGYAQQKLVELCRILMTDPEMILLDELMAGISPAFAERLLDYVRTLRDEQGITFLVVEHNMHVVMTLCEWIVVLNYGEKIAEGTPEQVSSNPVVIDAYLGV